MKFLKSLGIFHPRYLGPIYGVALFSFICAVVRDFILVSNVERPDIFFNMLYIAGLSASLVINYIALGSGRYDRRFVLLISFSSLIVVSYWSYRKFENLLIMIPYQVILICLWVWGAIVARSLFTSGYLVIGKSRELIASLFCIVLLLLNFEILSSFILSVLISVLMLKYIEQIKISSTHRLRINSDLGKPFLKSIMELFLTNISVICAYCWALAYGGEVFNQQYKTDYIIRFSIYIFQAITIGASLVTFSKWKPKISLSNISIMFFAISVLYLVTEANFIIGALLMPLILGIMHWMGCFLAKSL